MKPTPCGLQHNWKSSSATPEHAVATVQTRVARREQERERLELITEACRVEVVAHLIACFFFLQAQDVETEEPSTELVTGTVESGGTAPRKLVTPEGQFVQELVRR